MQALYRSHRMRDLTRLRKPAEAEAMQGRKVRPGKGDAVEYGRATMCGV